MGALLLGGRRERQIPDPARVPRVLQVEREHAPERGQELPGEFGAVNFVDGVDDAEGGVADGRLGIE